MTATNGASDDVGRRLGLHPEPSTLGSAAARALLHSHTARSSQLQASGSAPSASLEEALLAVEKAEAQQEEIWVSDTKPPPGRKFWSHLWTAFHLKGDLADGHPGHTSHS